MQNNWFQKNKRVTSEKINSFLPLCDLVCENFPLWSLIWHVNSRISRAPFHETSKSGESSDHDLVPYGFIFLVCIGLGSFF